MVVPGVWSCLYVMYEYIAGKAFPILSVNTRVLSLSSNGMRLKKMLRSLKRSRGMSVLGIRVTLLLGKVLFVACLLASVDESGGKPNGRKCRAAFHSTTPT